MFQVVLNSFLDIDMGAESVLIAIIDNDASDDHSSLPLDCCLEPGDRTLQSSILKTMTSLCGTFLWAVTEYRLRIPVLMPSLTRFRHSKCPLGTPPTPAFTWQIKHLIRCLESLIM